MTLEEFMTEFETHAKDAKWLPLLGTAGAIRNEKGECPGCYVATVLGLNDDRQRVAPYCTDLELNDEDMDAVIIAADTRYPQHGSIIADTRYRMLQAAGL